MKLALFDLDHTLIPFDSGLAWTRFLVARGRLPAEAEPRYVDFCHHYAAGTLDIHAMHRASLTPLADWAADDLARCTAEFEREVAPRVPAASLALVGRHQAAGDLCAIVTATTRLIAEPFARLFGIAHLIASEAERQDGRLTGEIAGDPCFRAFKVRHVRDWLAGRGQSIAGFDESTFYSDSVSDLPLLQAVTRPVAVNPDPRLRDHAQAAGWPVIDAT